MSLHPQTIVTIKCDVPGCPTERVINADQVEVMRRHLVAHQDWTSNGASDWCGWHPQKVEVV